MIIESDGQRWLLTLGDQPNHNNVMVGQGLWGTQPADGFTVRLRTDQADYFELYGPVTDNPASGKSKLIHLVFTHKASTDKEPGLATLYLNGQIAATAEVDGNLIKIFHKKPELTDSQFIEEMKKFSYARQKICRKEFEIAYKIDTKYEIQKSEIAVENGMMTVTIPLKEENIPVKKTLKIG